jgi:hypothetical protein
VTHVWCVDHAAVIIGDDNYCCDSPKHRKIGRVWAWAPDWYWHGWRTLLPMWRAADEFGRRTLVVGWTFTGRVIFALWVCGCIECQESREQTAEMEREDAA